MKKTLGIMTIAASMGVATAQAQDWRFFPGGDDDYRAQPTVSLIYGRTMPSATGFKDGNIAGIELSLNCPMLQPPRNRIRQQLSYIHYSQADKEIDALEINPHYVVEIAPDLEIGGGPGLAYIKTTTQINDPSLWGLNLGLSVHYRGLGPVFIGAEYRYQITSDEDFGNGTKEDLNNSRYDIKLGYEF